MSGCAAVRNVFNNGIKANEPQIWSGSLRADCLISLLVGQGAGDTSYPVPSRATEPPAAAVQEIRLSMDEVGKRVIFERWGEIRGVGAELLIALATLFREARQNELAPERFPFMETQKLMRQTKCESLPPGRPVAARPAQPHRRVGFQSTRRQTHPAASLPVSRLIWS
jgi:hypothetical protein